MTYFGASAAFLQLMRNNKVVPKERFDLKIEEDLIEELIRVIGYDQLPLTPPLVTFAHVKGTTASP